MDSDPISIPPSPPSIVGTNSDTVGTDVRSRDAVHKSIAATAEELGAPSILFIKAGVQKLQGIFEMEDGDIDLIIDVNLKGALYTIAEAAALMRDAGEGGAIVLMASDQALVGKEGSIVLSPRWPRAWPWHSARSTFATTQSVRRQSRHR